MDFHPHQGRPKRDAPREVDDVKEAPLEVDEEKDDDLQKLFKRLDKDKNGFLDSKELKPLSKKMAISSKVLLSRMDTNKDKKVNFSEFARYMKQHAGGFKGAMKPGVQKWFGEQEGVSMGTGRKAASKGRVGGYKRKHKVKKVTKKMPKLDK